LGNSKWVLLSGLAGMIASALSMGSGAYLASKSEREIYEAELAREREAIAMNGAEARELLSLYYQVKGLPPQDADHMVDHIASDPEQMLRALAAERLNSTEDALSNPLTSAITGALSTAAGAFIPIVPFLFLSRHRLRGSVPGGPFRSGRGQVISHRAFLVEQRFRDDLCRRGGRGRDLCDRPGSRPSWRITA
jgi:VIT1/CCC1 family predicted Fe2+/Mn2+ transporter